MKEKADSFTDIFNKVKAMDEAERSFFLEKLDPETRMRIQPLLEKARFDSMNSRNTLKQDPRLQFKHDNRSGKGL